MEPKVIPFKTIGPIYDKEKSGVKPNTNRIVDFKDQRFRDLALMALGFEPMGYVKIENVKDSNLNFTRKIKDITFFDDRVTISWEIFKVVPL